MLPAAAGLRPAAAEGGDQTNYFERRVEMKAKKLAAIAAAAVMITASGCNKDSTDQNSQAKTETAAQTTAVTPTQEETETVKKIEYEIDPSKPVIALTFDDGPNTTATPKVLEKLEKYQVKASFFVIGNNINDESGAVMKKAHDMGCEINNHSKTHSYMTQMSSDEIKEEIEFTNEQVKKYTGDTPKFFRPPYISVHKKMYNAIDMPFINGVGANDWDNSVSAEERADRILEQVQDGVIILLHDADNNFMTVEALDTIIPELQAQGYQFATVSELFEAKGVPIDPEDENLYTVVGG